MSRACTLADVLDALPSAQRESLLRLNPHLRPRIAKAVARGKTVDASARRDGNTVTLIAKGLRLTLTPNELRRIHPQKEARTRRHEHAVIRRALAGITPPPGPWKVTITRIGPARVDIDAAWTSAKAVQDEIAAWAGVDDGDNAWTWDVRREVAPGYAVRITIEGSG